MEKKEMCKIAVAGAMAGIVNGIFGAGGGMVLVPLLIAFTNLEERQVFPSSIWIILPICAVSLFSQFSLSDLPYKTAFPYLLGSIPGGILAVYLGKYIPTKWLHRALGIMILYGGVRYLC